VLCLWGGNVDLVLWLVMGTWPCDDGNGDWLSLGDNVVQLICWLITLEFE